MTIQTLLDAEAVLGNVCHEHPELKEKLQPAKNAIIEKVMELRGTDKPACYGQDDCSTMILIRCPWRFTCGD